MLTALEICVLLHASGGMPLLVKGFQAIPVVAIQGLYFLFNRTCDAMCRGPCGREHAEGGGVPGGASA